MKGSTVNEEENLEFRPLPFFKEMLLPKEALPEYYRKKREYEYNNGTILKGIGWRDKLHPLLLKLFTLNRCLIDKQTLTVMGDKRVRTDKPVIYAITHIGKFDLQIVSEAIKDHQYTFAGDPETMYRTSDGFFLSLNGLVYCDTESKTDRKVAQATAVDLLNKGENLMMYPEGVWNLSSNLLMLPLFSGTINIAQQTGCEIVPVAIEQYGNDFIVNIGSNIKIDKEFLDEEDNKKYIEEQKQSLRDVMATLKWEIVETRKMVKRSELGEYEDEENKFIDTRLDEWFNPKTKENYYTRDIVESRTFRPKGVTVPEEAFNYFYDLKLNKNNAFCFRKDFSLPTKIQTNIKRSLDELYVVPEEDYEEKSTFRRR